MKSVKFSRTSEDNKTKVSISSKLLIWRLWVKIFNARNGSDILSCISNAPDSLAKAQVHPYCFGRMYFFCFETVRVNEEKCQRLLQGKKNNYCFLNWAREYCEEEIGGGHSLYSLDCAQSSIFPCDCFERYSWARAVAILISRGKKLLRSVTFGWRVWISSTTHSGPHERFAIPPRFALQTRWQPVLSNSKIELHYRTGNKKTLFNRWFRNF